MPSNTLSLRRAKAAFRFDEGRDDLDTSGVRTTYVFAPIVPTENSPAAVGGHSIGLFGAPVAVLDGFLLLTAEDSRLRSVVRPKTASAAFVMGRIGEVTMSELARLDRVAELCGDYHRFLTEVTMPSNGYVVEAWVYQLREHATDLEVRASALELGFATTRHDHTQTFLKQ